MTDDDARRRSRLGDAVQPDEAVTRWITGHAHPFAGVDVDDHLDDLQPLAAMVGDAVVVGLARPTHGAHELSRLTHRILRYLVEHLGFRSLAVEEDWTTGIELDSYLRSGVGDPRALLRHAFPQWQNEEFLDVLRWLRAHNERHPADPVRLVGLDVSSVRTVAYDAATTHVRRVAPDLLDDLNAHHDAIRPVDPIDEHTAWYLAQPDKQPHIDHARRAYDLVDALPVDDGHALALQHARAIVAYHELYAIDSTNRMTYLEARLADHLIWWQEHTGHKILYWSGSHSAVGDARTVDFGGHADSEPSRNAGSHLREHFGRRYLSGGLTLHHGAIALGSTSQTIPAPQHGRPDEILGRVGLDGYLLDLRADQPPAVRAWLRSPTKLRLIGPGYSPAHDADHHMSGGGLVDWFDLIVHRQEVTPTTALAIPRNSHRPTPTT